MAAEVVRHPASGLPARKRRALELLVAGLRPGDVAETLGINRKTLYKWRMSADFEEAYDALQLELQDQVQSILVGRATGVVESLGDIATDSKQPGMARVHAARVFLELLGWHKGAPVRRPERSRDIESEGDLLDLLREVPPHLLREVLGDTVEADEGE